MKLSEKDFDEMYAEELSDQLLLSQQKVWQKIQAKQQRKLPLNIKVASWAAVFIIGLCTVAFILQQDKVNNIHKMDVPNYTTFSRKINANGTQQTNINTNPKTITNSTIAQSPKSNTLEKSDFAESQPKQNDSIAILHDNTTRKVITQEEEIIVKDENNTETYIHINDLPQKTASNFAKRNKKVDQFFKMKDTTSTITFREIKFK